MLLSILGCSHTLQHFLLLSFDTWLALIHPSGHCSNVDFLRRAFSELSPQTPLGPSVWSHCSYHKCNYLCDHCMQSISLIRLTFHGGKDHGCLKYCTPTAGVPPTEQALNNVSPKEVHFWKSYCMLLAMLELELESPDLIQWNSIP